LEEWKVEYTDEFGGWWDGLTEAEQEDVRAGVNLLRRFGPSLGRPHVDSVASSKHGNRKDLRIQHRGRPYRVLFIFDLRRIAVLLIGGDKPGTGRWHKEFVPVADGLYDERLLTLRKEGLLDG
jgi:hypothetical protein